VKPEQLIWDLLVAGFSTNCYDGQYFFDTDHPVLDANGATTSVANTDGGAGAAWFLLDVSRVIKPIILQVRRDFGDIVAKDKVTDDNVFDRNEFVYGVDARMNVGTASGNRPGDRSRRWTRLTMKRPTSR
jgi:phage major head subunit gpT-like protein